jgi:hypothetical protein
LLDFASFFKKTKSTVMVTQLKHSLDFFALYQKFVNDSRKGRRLQPNGKRISDGTTKNYCYTGLLLQRFCEAKGFELRIRSARRLNQRELNSEKNYWKKLVFSSPYQRASPSGMMTVIFSGK